MYQNQVHHHLQNLRQIKGILERITSEAGTHGVYLVDDSGFLIAEAGDIEIDRVTLSALVAASFGATAEIAKLLGETNFTQLTQQGTSRHIFICKAGRRHIVIAVFGRETNLGLVKLYVERAVVHLGAMLDYEPPSLTKVTGKAIVEEGEPEVEETVAEPVSMEPEAETEVREDEHFESLEQFIESESELEMMPTGTAETVEDQVVDEEIATADALVEDTSAEIDVGEEVAVDAEEEVVLETVEDAPLEEVEEAAQEVADEIIEEAEAVLEDEVVDISDDSGGADVGEVVEEVIGEEGEEQESLTVEEENVLEDEQEEEVDPEIARLTAELRTEIAHLREESKRLETELKGQDEEGIPTVEDTDEDFSPEDILGDDEEIETGTEDVPEEGAGENDKPDEEHTEDKDKEQKDRSRMFPSWLDDE